MKELWTGFFSFTRKRGKEPTHHHYEGFSLALVNCDSIPLSLNIDLAHKNSDEEGKSSW